ncbi:MAG: glutathione synthase [Neomegalonema sp.]|nr:glutathione synthase [Neomegalonema sp.]
MGLKVAIQMDPIQSVDINADSTFRLALEAQDRGHTLFYYLPDALAWQGGSLTAHGHRIRVQKDPAQPAILEPREQVDLSTMDVVLLRQDPPFDMQYISTTHMLEAIHPKTLVVNDPFWVRNSPEKVLVNDFQDLIAPTLITRDLDAVKAFRAEHQDIIIKPLYGNGGAGVFRLTAQDGNLSALFEMFVQTWREPFVVQKFLPAVSQGDKRVILVDGAPIGAINRLPQKGETRSNLHVGGTAAPVELTERDREICARIGPVLRERGLIFVGIDVIGDTLTEINVTSPTGIQEMERFTGINAAGLIWDAIEKRKAG